MAHRIITIDGPAGAGKTTVSKALARELGIVYVDTGALYRGTAYEIKCQSIDWEDDAELLAFLSELDLGFEIKGQNLTLISSGRDITPFIRTSEISMLASAVSAKQPVREALLSTQRKIAAEQSAVFEGRDMGTVVFPNADVKFFLSADLSVRAKRRFDETHSSQQDIQSITTEMAKRDRDDSNRDTAPLKPAADAVHIDSTDLTVGQVVDLMMSHITAA